MNLFPSFSKYFVILCSSYFCLWVYMIYGDVNVDEWCQELWQSVNQLLTYLGNQGQITLGPQNILLINIYLKLSTNKHIHVYLK